MGIGRAGGTLDDIVGGASSVPTGVGPAFAPDLAAGYGDAQDAAEAGWASGSGRRVGEGDRGDLNGLCSLTRQSSPPWDWGKGGMNGATFDDFLETFAGGRAEAVGQPPVESASAN